MGKNRVIFTKLFLLISSVIGVLFSIEIFFRLSHAVTFSDKGNYLLPVFVSGEEGRLFFEYDPYLGWRNKPYATGYLRTVVSKCAVSINSKGLRNRESSYTTTIPQGMRRILALGDSMVWGYGVEQHEIFSEKLEREFSNLEVINAGVCGYGTDQEFLYFEREGYKYQASLVLLFFVENDFVNNVRDIAHGYPKPRFVLRNGHLELINVPVPSLESYRAQISGNVLPTKRLSIQLPLNFYGIKRFLSEHSNAYIYFSSAIKNNPAAENFLTRHHLVSDVGIEVTEAILEKLENSVTTHGSKLVVVLIPFRQTLLTGFTPYSYQKIIDFCKKRDILYLDTTKPFYQYQKKNRQMLSFFPRDPHLNSKGHEVLAALVKDYIQKNESQLLP